MRIHTFKQILVCTTNINLLQRNRLLLASLGSKTFLVTFVGLSAGQVVFAGKTLVGQEFYIHLKNIEKTKNYLKYSLKSLKLKNTYTQSRFMAFTHWALDAITMGLAVLVVISVIL